ncbi:AMP-dependent synthetase/ligase [Acididesulfobacillus acetoxydans]|uniref:AMP-dependent synthetase/ligase n=2 Tax=Acididesulfobacillus acetoxydans TaxID=1561005 RepID=A0A8S0WV70_9FIRM|nr:AMP-dependent synthetase/ligase [Acididesulfobacillus acetoxydans]CEJ06783.1 Long-chain-fatty-acid--CoA ligase [Acididesulfobacillus acetoxydans]
MYAVDWLLRRSELSPHHPAVIDTVSGERLTYSVLNERSEKLAAFLYHETGLREGDRLAILAQNRPEHLLALFAAQKLGAVLVPLNFRLSRGELEYILRDSAPRVLLYDPGLKEAAAIRAAAGAEWSISLAAGKTEDCLFSKIMSETLHGDFPRPWRSLESAWLLLYTGGTTGFPKGALLSQRMVTWNAVNTAISWELTAADVAPIFTPFFHTGGLNVLTTPLIHLGGTLLLPGVFQPAGAIKLISEEKATVVFMVPTMFQMMAAEKDFAGADWSSVRFCISGGAPCPPAVYEAYWRKGLAFKQGYGLTEVGPNCFALNSADMRRKMGSVGKPVFHSAVKIISEDGPEAGVNEVGELLIKGNHTSQGYWHNAAATEAAFEDGWFRTGDLACRDEEGYYFIVDRKKDLIISGGENIYPVEVETVLYSHPDIQEAAVVGVAHEKWGEVPKAFLVLRPGASLTAEEVMAYCRTRLAGYKVPKEVEFRPFLPHSAAGKILKRELKSKKKEKREENKGYLSEQR